MQPGQSDLGINLHMRAHVRGALNNCLLQHLRAALIHVVFAEGGLGLPGLLDRFSERALLQMAAAHDAGLVQMDVGFQQAGQHQTAFEIEGAG